MPKFTARHESALRRLWNWRRNVSGPGVTNSVDRCVIQWPPPARPTSTSPAVDPTIDGRVASYNAGSYRCFVLTGTATDTGFAVGGLLPGMAVSTNTVTIVNMIEQGGVGQLVPVNYIFYGAVRRGSAADGTPNYVGIGLVGTVSGCTTTLANSSSGGGG